MEHDLCPQSQFVREKPDKKSNSMQPAKYYETYSMFYGNPLSSMGANKRQVDLGTSKIVRSV